MPDFKKNETVLLNSNQKEQTQKVYQNFTNLQFYNVIDEEYLYKIYRFQQALLDPKYKTELCKSFISEGFCRYRYKCRFGHGLQDLMSKNNNKLNNCCEKQTPKVISKDTSKENFRVENSFNSSSTDISIQSEREMVGICEDFSIRGYCKNGRKCAFSHCTDNNNNNDENSVNQVFNFPQIKKHKRLSVFENITPEFKNSKA